MTAIALPHRRRRPHHAGRQHLVPTLLRGQVDGQLAAQDPATTSETFSGCWRTGYNNLADWGRPHDRPSHHAFTGNMRFADSYPNAGRP